MAYHEPSEMESVGDGVRSSEPRCHSDFYFEEGNTIILVENVLYSIPRYLLKESAVFQTMFTLHPGPEETVDGMSKERPLDLSKADPSLHTSDFEPFLSVLCSSMYRPSDLSIDQLKSALHLARKWDFVDVEQYAVAQLKSKNLSPTERLGLGAKYGLETLLLEGYISVCCQPAPIYIAVYNALVPYFEVQKFFDLLRAKREVWTHLHGLLEQYPDNLAWNICLKKPDYCHNYEKFKAALQLVCKKERQGKEEDNPVATFEDCFAEQVAASGTQCSYCSSSLRERIQVFVKMFKIRVIVKHIMMPTRHPEQDPAVQET